MTENEDFRPLILTAGLPQAEQRRFNALREQHFPTERNHLAAHVTLFHALPGSERDAVLLRLRREMAEIERPEVAVTGLRSLGRGVAFVLQSEGLGRLHAALAEAWWPLLTAQDRQPLRPHVTIQNKVTPAEARATLEAVSAGFAPWRFSCPGIAVWRYAGGPWEAVSELRFRA